MNTIIEKDAAHWAPDAADKIERADGKKHCTILKGISEKYEDYHHVKYTSLWNTSV